MRHYAQLLLALSLGACSAAPTTPAPAPDVQSTQVGPAPASIEGDWRVAGIGGEALEEMYGLALSADAEEIWWMPRCAGFVLGYTLEGNSFTTGPRTTTPPAASGTPAPVCAIGLPPRLRDVMPALEAAERIETTDAGGVKISGGGRSLTLFRQ